MKTKSEIHGPQRTSRTCHVSARDGTVVRRVHIAATAATSTSAQTVMPRPELCSVMARPTTPNDSKRAKCAPKGAVSTKRLIRAFQESEKGKMGGKKFWTSRV